MPSVLAKTMAVLTAVLLVAVLAVLYLTSTSPPGANQVVAEFRNAFPLLEGMNVRVDGAIAGSVGKIGVNDEGLAEVTLVLDDSIETPSSDATAAIRQQDTTGDSYVAFDPGDSGKALPERDGKPTIACNSGGAGESCRRTLVEPRFDDLLNAFGPSQRAGIKLILVELSRALDDRGADLNQAALRLRPALVSANRALAEVNAQNSSLRSLIADAEAVSAQAAGRRGQLGELIDSLASTLQVSASSSRALDADLERLPATVGQARTTLTALTRTAKATTPLARELKAAAPGLASALNKAPDFLGDTHAFIDDTRPTLALTRGLLRDAAPTIEADPQRVVTGPFDLAPAISNLLTGVLGDKNTIKALFGDDSGGAGKGTLDNYGLGAVAVEPGNEPGYPADAAKRHFIRISAVLNCEAFGVPVAPGCLLDALKGKGARGPGPAKHAKHAKPTQPAKRPADRSPSASAGDGGGAGGGEQGGRRHDDATKPPPGGGELGDLLDLGGDHGGPLGGLGGGHGGGALGGLGGGPKGGKHGKVPAGGDGVSGLLDYLFN